MRTLKKLRFGFRRGFKPMEMIQRLGELNRESRCVTY